MILYIWKYLRGLFVKTAVIDYAKSVIWVKRYNAAGEFELYISASTETLKLFTDGETVVTREDEQTAMIAENVKLTTDVENGDYLTITGRSAESLIGRRIIPRQTIYRGAVENVIKNMLNDHLIKPVVINRGMDIIRLGDWDVVGEYIVKQVTGKNLLETISDLCVTYDYGFYLTFEYGSFRFFLYKGVDRSFAQNTNPYVIFSPEFENLGNTEYTCDTKECCNSVYVAGEGEGSNRVIVNSNTGRQGIFLREKWVDARQTSSETDTGELDSDEYEKILKQQADEEIELSKESTTFEGEFLDVNMYVYGVDYGLGDKVQIVNEYGIQGTAAVTEITEVEDENGYRIYPTLSEWSV